MTYYTHAGFFHADEVTGFVICRMAGICNQLERLADLSSIPDDGIVADIGRDWDPSENRFDHHQGFFPRESNGVPLASAGMLWSNFGMKAVQNITGEWSLDITMRVDETFIQGIDTHDADSSYKIEASCSSGKVRTLTISNAVSAMNNSDVQNHKAQYAAFMKAASFIDILLTSAIIGAKEFIEAKEKFAEIATIENGIIILAEALPWKEIVHELHPDAMFVIGPSNHPGNPYSMIAVPVEPESREIKRKIERPEWFSEFIHQGKWIAGGSSIEELKRLAQYNLK